MLVISCVRAAGRAPESPKSFYEGPHTISLGDWLRGDSSLEVTWLSIPRLNSLSCCGLTTTALYYSSPDQIDSP